MKDVSTPAGGSSCSVSPATPPHRQLACDSCRQPWLPCAPGTDVERTCIVSDHGDGAQTFVPVNTQHVHAKLASSRERRQTQHAAACDTASRPNTGKEGGDQARACRSNKSAAGWVEATRPRSISCSLAFSQKPFTACASSPYMLSGPPGSSASIVSTEASPRPTGCDACNLRIL